MGNLLRPIYLLMLAMFIAAVSFQRFSEGTEKGKLNVPALVFWNVGQGDLMTYIDDRVCWFFDLGGNQNLSHEDLLKLKNACQSKTVWAFISHFHMDHIQQFRRVDQFVHFQKLFVAYLTPKGHAPQSLLESFRRNRLPIEVLKAGDNVKGPNSVLHCLWPQDLNGIKDENSRSLVFLLKAQGKSILLTGDLPDRFDSKVIPFFSENSLHLDVLKVAHHGSRTSTGEKLLTQLRPKTCVISVGAGNKYGHPKYKLLERLKAARCAALRTDLIGTVQLEL